MSQEPGWRDQDRATACEYAILVALIAIVIVAAVDAPGVSARNLFTNPTLTGVFVP